MDKSIIKLFFGKALIVSIIVLVIGCNHKYSDKSLTQLYFMKDTLSMEDYNKLGFSITKDSINSFYKSSADTTFTVYTKFDNVVAKSLSIRSKDIRNVTSALSNKYNVCIDENLISSKECLNRHYQYLPVGDTLLIWKSYIPGNAH